MAKQEAGRNLKNYCVFLWEFRNVFDFVLFYKYLCIHVAVGHISGTL